MVLLSVDGSEKFQQRKETTDSQKKSCVAFSLAGILIHYHALLPCDCICGAIAFLKTVV